MERVKSFFIFQQPQAQRQERKEDRRIGDPVALGAFGTLGDQVVIMGIRRSIQRIVPLERLGNWDACVIPKRVVVAIEFRQSQQACSQNNWVDPVEEQCLVSLVIGDQEYDAARDHASDDPAQPLAHGPERVGAMQNSGQAGQRQKPPKHFPASPLALERQDRYGGRDERQDDEKIEDRDVMPGEGPSDVL